MLMVMLKPTIDFLKKKQRIKKMPVKSKTETQKKFKKISPPFGYFGSKNKIALEICSSLPPHNCWVEVFCGSASLTLRKIQAPLEIINDIDDEIVNVFEQLR